LLSLARRCAPRGSAPFTPAAVVHGLRYSGGMRAEEVEAILAACEQALRAGAGLDLRELGFWRAVSAVKRQPEFVERYADRIGHIDQLAFEERVQLRVPIAVGTMALGSGALLGLGMVATRKSLLLLMGAGLLLGTTHDLGHLVAGRLVGIRFTWWFLDGPTRVQPGLKTDYATYLRVPPRSRAVMHAAGALVTKVVPFAVLPLANQTWVRRVLVAIGMLQVLTDLVFSTRQSDWKRVRRELRVLAVSSQM
jgi:hypothetical protein